MIFSSAGGWDLPHSSSTTLPMPWRLRGTRQSRRALGRWRLCCFEQAINTRSLRSNSWPAPLPSPRRWKALKLRLLRDDGQNRSVFIANALILVNAEAPYSIDAICVGSLWGSDRTPPMATPTKNIAASNTAITPPFRGGVSLRICLSKSSRSCWSIFDVPIFVRAKRVNTCHCSADRRWNKQWFP
jgi:hypothetical protein